MAVDLSVFERQKTVLDQQQLQEAFNLKKRAMQMQELGAMAQIQKAMQPEQITPYQAATLELERQKMNTPQAITPYQQEQLKIQKQRLGMQGGTMIDPDTNEVVSTGFNQVKPLPVGALKMQDEQLSAIGALDTTAQTAGDWAKKLRAGKVPVAPLGKIEAIVRNKTGFSDESSRELGLYNTFIEKMRNDLLLLSKGVQTEGDAKRALAAIVAAGNDPNLMADAMEKASKVNQKASNLEKRKLNAVLSNYGRPEIPETASAAPSETDGATATNPQTGQKIKLINGQWEPVQ